MSDQMSASVAFQLAHIDESRKGALIAATTTCLVLAYLAVALRFLSRWLIRTSIKADDWTIVLGLFLATVFDIVIFELVHLGLGRHIVLVKHLVTFVKLITVSPILYNLGIVAVKASILILYGRIFPGRRMRLILWGIGIFIFLNALALALAVIFECSPINATWNLSVKGKCINLADLITACSSFNVATDFLILALPMPILWGLHASRQRKLELIGVFSLGGFICIISIVRTVYVRFITKTDISWSDVTSAIWTVVEVNIGVVSACLPTLRPIVNYVIHGRDSPSYQADYTGPSVEASDVRRRGFKGISKGEYGNLDSSLEMRKLVHPQTARVYQNNPDRGRDAEGPPPPPWKGEKRNEMNSEGKSIRVTTELDVSMDKSRGGV